MNKVSLIALAGAIAAITASPAGAQQIHQKAIQKVNWFNGNREIQIIDERPIIRDFREAPASSPMINLPPGPQGSPGGAAGMGALGGNDGGVLPAGGMQIGGGGDPGYRTPNQGSLPLPKADFGHAVSNIPARGMGPKGVLPNGQTTGIHGKVLTPTAHSVAPASGPGAGGYRGTPGTVHTPVASYGSGYAPSGLSTGGNSSSTSVRAKLMSKIK